MGRLPTRLSKLLAKHRKGNWKDRGLTFVRTNNLHLLSHTHTHTLSLSHKRSTSPHFAIFLFMNDPPLHIAHIRESITDNLSFTDILCCVLVSRAWHNTFIPILYQDAITYRSIKEPPKRTWTCLDYSQTIHGQQALTKHAHHIQALTCQGRHSLQILRASGCVNLSEINYVVKSSGWDLGLSELADLITVNPQLHAVSIEKFACNGDDHVAQISHFLDFLDDHPGITSVYLEVRSRDLPLSLHQEWRNIWHRLLARIPANIVRSLHIRSAINRSSRGSAGRQPWPARERSSVEVWIRRRCVGAGGCKIQPSRSH
jgi:hypothetical protein